MNLRAKYFAILLLTFSGSAFAASYSANHDKVADYFKSDMGRSIIDATWTSEVSLKLGRFATGTKQNAYARRVCDVLYTYGFKGKQIHVNIVESFKFN